MAYPRYDANNKDLFLPLEGETRRLLEGIPALIDKTFPLPARFRSSLPAGVAELSRLLTSGRGERGFSYLGRPDMLSAYLRFFLPWNLYRLCRLLPALGLTLAANDAVTDLGCGPLTFAAALWICRPDLRSLPLVFRCIDRSGPALEAGKKFFAALSGDNCPWKITAIKSDLEKAKAVPSALVCAANVFNEMFGDISRTGAAQRSVQKYARLLESHAASSSAILSVEPGTPRCGEFISLLRGEYIVRGRPVVSPCPHSVECPIPGGMSKAGKNRWCHFAFDTEDAPSALHRLSQAAGLPKERAVLSFLFTVSEDTSHRGAEAQREVRNPITTLDTPCLRASVRNKGEESLRVVSDAFTLPGGRRGRYCCSRQGLVLLAGERSSIEKTGSGALVNAVIKSERDPKSGALVAGMA
jgi:hypothetical protein